MRSFEDGSREGKVKTGTANPWIWGVCLWVVLTSGVLAVEGPPVSSPGSDAPGARIQALERLLQEVQARQKDLEAREARIREEEARLQALRNEIEASLKQAQALMDQIQEWMNAGKRAPDPVRQLVRAYESMPPEEAAARLATLDVALSVELLLRMKPKAAGKILAQMPEKQAARLTQALAQKGGPRR